MNLMIMMYTSYCRAVKVDGDDGDCQFFIIGCNEDGVGPFTFTLLSIYTVHIYADMIM